MQSDEYAVRVPSTITFRDLVYIAIVLVTITTSFLLYGTRLSVMEQQMLTVGDNISEMKLDIKQIIRDSHTDDSNVHESIEDLQDRQRDLEAGQAKIEWHLENLNGNPADTFRNPTTP